MALSGGISVLVDVGILPALHKRRLLPELVAGLLGGLLVASGLLALALSATTRGFFLGLTLLSLGASLFKSSLAAIVMGCARRDEAGTISGAMDAMEAVCRVVAPIAGGAWALGVGMGAGKGIGALGVGMGRVWVLGHTTQPATVCLSLRLYYSSRLLPTHSHFLYVVHRRAAPRARYPRPRLHRL